MRVTAYNHLEALAVHLSNGACIGVWQVRVLRVNADDATLLPSSCSGYLVAPV